MKPIWSVSLLLLSLLGLSGCHTMRSVKSDFDPGMTFSGYKTFGFAPISQDADPVQELSPILLKRLQRHIEKNLQAKGFALVEAEENPDFKIKLHGAVNEKTVIHNFGLSHPYSMSDSYYSIRPTNLLLPSYRTREYEEATWVIDIIHAQNDELLWRGTGKSRLRTGPPSDETLTQIAAELLKTFPPTREEN